MRTIIIVIIAIIVFNYNQVSGVSLLKTQVFRQVFTEHQAQENYGALEIIFCQEDIHLFNQLIFSWNSLKPLQGYFSFFGQIRDAHTKKWYGAHHMADWGSTLKRSYSKSSAQESSYHHVRLEAPSGTYADAFRITITPHKGASLDSIKGLIVNTVNLKLFEKVEDKNSFDHLPSVMVDNVPCYSQMIINHARANHMCSPTSLSMLLGYITLTPIDTLQTAHGVYDKGLDAFGSWPFNIAYAFEYCQGNFLFYSARLASFEALHTILMKKMPVIVSIRGPLKGAAGEYIHGHLMIVIGWDKENKKVICHDPAFKKNSTVRVEYAVQDFIQAWGRSSNLSYIAEKITV